MQSLPLLLLALRIGTLCRAQMAVQSGMTADAHCGKVRLCSPLL